MTKTYERSEQTPDLPDTDPPPLALVVFTGDDALNPGGNREFSDRAMLAQTAGVR